MVNSGKDQCKKETGSTSGKYIPYLFGPHTLEGHPTNDATSSANKVDGEKSMDNGNKTTTDSATPTLTINSSGGLSDPKSIEINDPQYYVLAFIIKTGS